MTRTFALFTALALIVPAGPVIAGAPNTRRCSTPAMRPCRATLAAPLTLVPPTPLAPGGMVIQSEWQDDGPRSRTDASDCDSRNGTLPAARSPPAARYGASPTTRCGSAAGRTP